MRRTERLRDREERRAAEMQQKTTVAAAVSSVAGASSWNSWARARDDLDSDSLLLALTDGLEPLPAALPGTALILPPALAHSISPDRVAHMLMVLEFLNHFADMLRVRNDLPANGISFGTMCDLNRSFCTCFSGLLICIVTMLCLQLPFAELL